VLSRRVEDGIVLVHLETNRMYELNRTGARFWELLETSSNRAEIEEALASQFDVDRDELRREIDTLADELSAAGLLEQA
jgi:Coenzyme PQQ synthesis protein D (PqqD)